jgi:hypothetical protein
MVYLSFLIIGIIMGLAVFVHCYIFNKPNRGNVNLYTKKIDIYSYIFASTSIILAFFAFFKSENYVQRSINELTYSTDVQDLYLKFYEEFEVECFKKFDSSRAAWCSALNDYIRNRPLHRLRNFETMPRPPSMSSFDSDAYRVIASSWNEKWSILRLKFQDNRHIRSKIIDEIFDIFVPMIIFLVGYLFLCVSFGIGLARRFIDLDVLKDKSSDI